MLLVFKRLLTSCARNKSYVAYPTWLICREDQIRMFSPKGNQIRIWKLYFKGLKSYFRIFWQKLPSWQFKFTNCKRINNDHMSKSNYRKQVRKNIENNP